MQIKHTWTEQVEKGFMSEKFIYQLVIRAALTQNELDTINKYKVMNAWVYSNREEREAQKISPGLSADWLAHATAGWHNGGIVLVNTAKDFMKTEASSIFGRYIIALTFKAAMERAIMPEHTRHPTFLWIDEASEYFDDNIDSLLIQARKYKLGIIMAHQYLGQLPRGLPASIMTNTSIKLAGGLSDKDNREMSREMRWPRFHCRHDQRAQANPFRRLCAKYHTPGDEAFSPLRHSGEFAKNAKGEFWEIAGGKQEEIVTNARQVAYRSTSSGYRTDHSSAG